MIEYELKNDSVDFYDSDFACFYVSFCRSKAIQLALRRKQINILTLAVT